MQNKEGLLGRLVGWVSLDTVVTGIRGRFRNKLLFWLLTLALAPLIILGAISYKVTSDALMAKASDNLEAVQTNKVFAVEDYLYKSQSDMNTLLETVKALRQEAFDQLRSVLTLKKGQIEGYFSDRVSDARALAANPMVTSALTAFMKVGGGIGGKEWQEVERTYGPWLARYMDEYGYIDLFLVSNDGRVFYTVEQASDLGQNLKTGKLKNSPAGKAFQKGLISPAIQDFEAYEPSGGVPAAFIAAPVVVGESIEGVAMIQIPIDQINAIMQERTGLGASGETYLVGADKLFRSDSRFAEDSTILDPHYLVNTKAVENALANKTGEKIIQDYRGRRVLSAFAPLEIRSLSWVIMAEVSVEEAFVPYVEGEIEDFLTTYKEAYGYYDLYLFNPDGYLFYTVEQEADYRTNFLNGKYRDTNLGRLVSEVLASKEFGIADFERYAPANNLPAAFVARPLVHQGQVELVVAAQLSLDHINAVMQERAGLGETGETYLVGPDKLWRNNSNFLKQLGVKNTTLNPKTMVDTVAHQKAMLGEPGTQIIDDYRGIPVLSSWSTITVKEPTKSKPDGVKWAIISQIDLKEVKKPLTQIAILTGAVLAGTIILLILAAMVLSGGLTAQVRRIMDLFGNIGMGDFEARAEVTSIDELGTLATSLNAMLDNTLSLIQSQEERDAMQSSIMRLLDEISGLADGDLTRRAEVTSESTGAIADSFNAMAEQLSQVVKDVKGASGQVSTTSQEVMKSTENLAETSEAQAVQVTDAIAAINEMATSIQQVAANAAESAMVSEQSTTNARSGAEAVEKTNSAMNAIRENVQETARTIKRLGESSQEIGNIVQLINDIADRTSILALNAAIQAAMAGDAGRGFAVVAEEVQRLAERSTNATKEIKTLVNNIQSEINEAGASMDESIQRVVEGSGLAGDAHGKLQEIDSVSARLAELIQSISMAADQQAKASQNISKIMEEVGEVSTQTSAASRQTAVAMEKLADTSDQLNSSVDVFKLEEEMEKQSDEEPPVEEEGQNGAAASTA
jgi:methyl-accepting chemotaxis protein